MPPPKKTAKPKAKPPDDKRPQRERFIEAAEKAGVDGEAFESAMGRIVSSKKPKA